MAYEQHHVILGLGSNINPEENIKSAIQMLNDFGTIQRYSDILETEPIGITDQPNFLNCCVSFWTDLDQETLNLKLKELEDRLKRDRTAPKFGPRTIDIDIIIWNKEIIDPDYHKRAFLKKCVDQISE